MQSLMDSARKQAIEKVHNDYLAALSRERLLDDAMTKAKGDVNALNQKMIEHNILKREFEINQQLYESLLQRLKDATLSASLQATNVNVIDPATPPVHPVRPNKMHNMAAGLMMGLILGIIPGFRAGSPRHLGADHGRGGTPCAFTPSAMPCSSC